MNHLRACLLLLAGGSLCLLGSPCKGSDEEGAYEPKLSFFYYDNGNVEWVTSAETDRFEAHLNANSNSASLYRTFSESISRNDDAPQARARMTRWIEQERDQFNGYNPVRFRKAEGIVAYLRAHDFSIENLVQDLLKRSGARIVELVVIHLVDSAGESSYQMKVMLPDNSIGLVRQGFNVGLPSETVTYTSVVYALGVALYEVQERVNAESEETPPEDRPYEELPIPSVGF